MRETLTQALQLTALGMGMTFASIGALALGMLVMTYLTNNPFGALRAARRIKERKSVTSSTEPSASGRLQPSDPVAAQAAAAAVAVALAEQASAGTPATGAMKAAAAAVAVSLVAEQSKRQTDRPGAEGVWDAYARGQHLSRRAGYEARRFRN